MRRALVLTNEAARHPVRVRIPPCRNLPARPAPAPILTLDDLRDFLLAFCAFFLAAMVFIA